MEKNITVDGVYVNRNLYLTYDEVCAAIKKLARANGLTHRALLDAILEDIHPLAPVETIRMRG